jgi:hypothetical protein
MTLDRMIIFCAGIAAGVTITLFVQLGSDDLSTRLQEKYRDCQMVGDMPTAADMLPEETGQ